jgi:hypothetical protein
LFRLRRLVDPEARKLDTVRLYRNIEPRPDTEAAT